MKRVTGLFLLAVFCTACTADNPGYSPDPFLPGECRVGVEVTETFDGYENPALLDILVVIDNSGDVEDLQSGLARALPTFLDGLVEDGADVQLVVATTDATGPPSIALPGNTADGCQGNTVQVAKSSDDGWTRAAACNVQQGTTGDSYQQSLAVARGLLSSSSSIREGARRLVLVVSNEDDCSNGGVLPPTMQPRRECLTNVMELTSVKAITDELLAIPSTPQGLMFAVISGPPAESPDGEARVRPVCSSALGSTYSAGRLFEATQAFGAQGKFLNGCVQDMSTPLQALRTELLPTTSTTFCPARKLAHEPLWVQGTDADDNAFNILVGGDGFVFEGVTTACENGALSLAPNALSRASSFEVAYCVEQ